MSPKSYYSTTGMIFLIIGVLHLLRIFNSWPARINTFTIPIWASWVALLLSAFLAYQGLKKK